MRRRIGLSLPDAVLLYTATCGGYWTERNNSLCGRFIDLAIAKARWVTFKGVRLGSTCLSRREETPQSHPRCRFFYRIDVPAGRIDPNATVELNLGLGPPDHAPRFGRRLSRFGVVQAAEDLDAPGVGILKHNLVVLVIDGDRAVIGAVSRMSPRRGRVRSTVCASCA